MFSLFQWPTGDERKRYSISADRRTAKLTEIDGRGNVFTVAFLEDGQQVISGGSEGKVRPWRVQDGKEAGRLIDPGGTISNIAVSHDGQWFVTGTWDGWVTVWNSKSHKKSTDLSAHTAVVRAVDISHDGRRIVTGSEDSTVCVWSLANEQRPFEPLQHEGPVCAAKFSPDGNFIATATWSSVRVYDGHRGTLCHSFSIKVGSNFNQSLVWAGDSKRLFVLSEDGFIHILELPTGRTLSKWPTHDKQAHCIALASNGTFIAVSAGSSVSFWDTSTRKQIEPILKHTANIVSMAISSNHCLVTAGGKKISLHSLRSILPAHYCDNAAHQEKASQSKPGRDASEDEPAPAHTPGDSSADKDSRVQLAEFRVQSPHEQELNSSSKIVHLENTVAELCTKLAESRGIIDSLRVELDTEKASSSGKIANLEKIVEGLHTELDTQKVSSNERIKGLEDIVTELREQFTASQYVARQEKDCLRVQLNDLTQMVRAREQKDRCEALFSQGRMCDAANALIEMTSTEDAKANKFHFGWLTEFAQQCLTALEKVGDEASDTGKLDEAGKVYSTALRLGSSTASTLIKKWANITLTRGSVHKALNAASKFKVPRFLAYQVICDILEGDGRLPDVIECFQEMQNELKENMDNHEERRQWGLDLRARCIERSITLSNIADESCKHDNATGYSQLDLTITKDVLLKYSNEIVELDSSSHIGHKGKHAALHAMGHHKEAFEAFKTMLSKLQQSSNPDIRELYHQYIDPTVTIKKAVKEATRHMPYMLIDTETGHLYNKAKQRAAFEELPIYDELRSSMTRPTELDQARIQKEVQKFYRYVMLSHKWRAYEPTLQIIGESSVYELPASTENDKVQQFCKLGRSLRVRWAWTDTCCVNQQDKRVLEESLVAMFKWYCGSFVTIVHLHDVPSESQEFGLLWKSIWNTRGWTYQEYIASKVVQFYTKDWKPYLGLDMFNHKDSPRIIKEMERVTKFSTKKLSNLQPGFDMAREKLYLASRRQTEREEDIAYCLFGIFGVSLPIMYGEGNQAVGRLLEHILARSNNATLLAWTGTSGSQYSYLPVDLTVYDQVVPPHVPLLIPEADMESMVAGLRTSVDDPPISVALYEQFHSLRPLSISAGRLRVPGIIFPLSNIVALPEPDSSTGFPVYHATTRMLGNVVITTRDDLSGKEGLTLIHPWISPLLDQDFSRGVPLFDSSTRALRLIVRLMRPFGALLLAPWARTQYKRVATDSLIMVQIREGTPLTELMDGISTVDVQ